ncbi:hypothetical protein FGG08_007306 [Glutinoglossum americanum]|uniref:Nucleoside phosphorylase domain-containing protein n=1 Tax=Glutinoglossum americanum TaxID=1670608 RepID=A0A9P8I3M7_9PEZI|nr:hypothetical protein FGG08_007306 [Glutinoglossum americanum]
MTARIMQPEISIGIICPLPIEVAAMIQMLDERYDTQQFLRDPNLYHLGRIGQHNIVIAGLPDGLTGIASAATTAERLWVTFHSVKALLLVGIGGGVRTIKNDMRLGDVIVSRPDGKYGGVVQYNFGKSLSEGRFEHTGVLNSPPREVLSTLAAMKANHLLNGNRLPDYAVYVEASQSNLYLKYPGVENDILFEADYDHAGGSDCASCDRAREIKRKPRKANGPVIHYGTIASGNQLMRNSKERDSYNRDYDDRILCFEMEAAGLMNSTPCLAIRGISDYADSHKREDHAWHGYAAAAAAGFAKEFINTIPSSGLENMPTVAESLAKEDKPNEHWLVPFQRNQHFVGRESQLNELGTKISSEAHCQRVAIVGLGGVGKTQIVLEFAYRKRESSPGCSIFWIPTNNPTTFEQAYLQIGRLLQIPGITEENADVKQLVKMRLSQESAGHWLLILDNADDIGMLYKRAYGDNRSLRLIDFLPSSCRGSIIFTTRNQKAAVRQAGSNLIKVYEMDLADAKEVLEASLIQTHILKDDEATVKLLDLLTYLPLAIVQAAAFINENDISIPTYIALYENGQDEVIELLSEDFEDQGRYKDTKNPIATTWLISFNQISLQDPLAADYLSFMSCIAPQRIPESLLPSTQSKIKMTIAIGTLAAYSFITKRELEKSFDLHRLVHLATRNWLRTTQSLAAWTEKTLSRLADVFPIGDHKNKAIWMAYLPHARHVLASPHPSDGSKEAEIKLLYKVGWCLLSNGQYSEAEQMHRKGLELSEKVLGLEHPDTLASRTQLGWALRMQGKYAKAEQMERQTLELKGKVLGLEHPDTLNSMNELARALDKQGKNAEAEQMCQQALELREKVLGPEHPDTLASRTQLGWALRMQGEYAKAEQMERQTLELKGEVLGPEHPDTLTSMNELAGILHSQGKYTEAEQVHRQALELRKKVLGPEHPDTLTSMSGLVRTLERQGEYARAEQMHRQALELREKVLGLEHPDTLVSRTNLARALGVQGKYSKAEQMHRKGLELREEVLGPEHPDTLAVRTLLGWVLRMQGKYTEAEQMERQTLELKEKVLGLEHPATLASMNELARVLDSQGADAEAKQMYRQALKLREKMLGPEHPDTLVSKTDLVRALGAQGKYTEAEQMERQTLELIEKVLGPKHPDALAAKTLLGWVLGMQGKYTEAEQMERQTLELKEKVLGPEHPDTLGKYTEAEQMERQTLGLSEKVLGPKHPDALAARTLLGWVLGMQGKYTEAEQMERQTLELKEKVLGPEHPHTLMSRTNLACALRAQGKYTEAEQMHRQGLELG